MEDEKINNSQDDELEKSALKLKNLIENDIINGLAAAVERNIITENDRKELLLITDLLYNELYGGIETLDRINVREALDEQLALFADGE